MRFLNPAGLWLLLLIPILIIIYIIRARHEERAVSSTFIWKLSLRFMKKKIPFHKFRKILLFTCQLLMILAVALLVSKPALVTEGGAKEYILIIDGSVSMNIADSEGETRFERALELIRETVNDAPYGTPVSIILADENPTYLAERSENETEIGLALKYAKCGGGSGSITDALGLAELICEKNAVTDVILFTDHSYEVTENVSVVNVSDNEWNLSFTDLSYEKRDKEYIFTATLLSNNESADIAVALSVDGKTLDAKIVSCEADTETAVSFSTDEIKDFDVATIYTEADDGLADDNSYSVCKRKSNDINVLLVSASPLYLESVLNVMGNCTLTVAGSLEDAALSGYGLYIFDGIFPEELPTDGSVWLFDPDTAPDGMAIGEKKEGELPLSMSLIGSGSLHSALSGAMKLDAVSVSSYTKLVAGKSWESLLTCGEDTVLFTRKESNGMRTVVFAFDLHDSNLPLLVDYVMLVRELLAYSVPEMLTDTDYAIGESLSIAVLPLSESIYLEIPDGDVVTLSNKASSASLEPDAVGVYTAVQTLTDGGAQYVDFFVHIPFSEMKDEPALQSLSIDLADTSIADVPEAEDGLNEIWFWVLAALLFLILAEWGVYYYEQF